MSTTSMFRRWRSLVRSDFETNEFWEPRLTLAVWRLGQVAHGVDGPAAFAVRRLHGVLDQVWVRGQVGAELPRSVQVGPRLRLPHSGRGVVLHPSCRLGSDVTLYHGVTLGITGESRPPVVEDGAYLGSGAKIVGAVTIGSGARIGANAVVLRDVPARETAVGVPARLRSDRS